MTTRDTSYPLTRSPAPRPVVARAGSESVLPYYSRQRLQGRTPPQQRAVSQHVDRRSRVEPEEACVEVFAVMRDAQATDPAATACTTSSPNVKSQLCRSAGRAT